MVEPSRPPGTLQPLVRLKSQNYSGSGTESPVYRGARSSDLAAGDPEEPCRSPSGKSSSVWSGKFNSGPAAPYAYLARPVADALSCREASFEPHRPCSSPSSRGSEGGGGTVSATASGKLSEVVSASTGAGTSVSSPSTSQCFSPSEVGPGERDSGEIVSPFGADEETLEERMERFRQRKARKKAERTDRRDKGVLDYGSTVSSTNKACRDASATDTAPNQKRSSVPDRIYKPQRSFGGRIRKYVTAQAVCEGGSVQEGGMKRFSDGDMAQFLVPMQPSTSSSSGSPARYSRFSVSSAPGADHHAQASSPAESLEVGPESRDGSKEDSRHRCSTGSSSGVQPQTHTPTLFQFIQWPHGAGWLELTAPAVSNRSSISGHWKLPDWGRRQLDHERWVATEPSVPEAQGASNDDQRASHRRET